MSKIGAEIVITATTDAAVKGLNGVEGASTRARKAVDGLGSAGAGMGAKFGAMQGALEGANRKLQGLGTLLTAGGLVGTIGALGAALDATVQRAKEVTAVQQGLKVSLDGARAATGGLVADYSLMVAANKATTLGVVKTSEEFSKLSGVAAQLGASVGLDATQAVDDLTTALGRGSVMILDNLGISLKLQDAYDQYAARLGKASSALTDAEKKQAFMTVAMEKAEAAAKASGVTFDTNGAKLAKFAASWQNLKDKIALTVTDGLATAISPMDVMGKAVDDVKRRVDALGESSHTLQDRLVGIADKTNGATGSLAKLVSELTLTNEEMGRFQRAAVEEQTLAKAKERFLVIKGEEEARRRSMKIAERDRDINADLLQISKLQAASKREKAEIITPTDRGVDRLSPQAVEIDMIQRGREQAIAAEQQAIALQERRLEMLRIEASYTAGGNVDAQVAANDRVYAAELRLLQLRERATTESSELFDIQTQRQSMALNRQLAAQQAAAQKSATWMKFMSSTTQSHAGLVADAWGAMAVAAMDSADNEEHAAMRALYGWAKSVRNQMLLMALKEAALGAAAAAGIYTAALAPGHFAAAAVAGAAAAAAAGITGIVGANLPASGAGGGGAATGGAGATPTPSAPTGGAGGGGSNNSTVPVSRPSEGVPASPRSNPSAAPRGGDTYVVLGATPDQIGTALEKIRRRSERREGGFAA